MSEKMKVMIGGRKYTLVYEENREYMEKITNYVNRKMLEQQRAGGGTEYECTVMAALEIADEYMKEHEELLQLKEQHKAASAELEKVKKENTELRRQLGRFLK